MYISDKTACQTLDSVSKMVIKRIVQNEPFVTKFPFILTKSRYLEKLSENDPDVSYKVSDHLATWF